VPFDFCLLGQAQHGHSNPAWPRTSAKVIVNSFGEWYRKRWFIGCSKPRQRRNFIALPHARFRWLLGHCEMLSHRQGMHYWQKIPLG
jgi:hypothetical protein